MAGNAGDLMFAQLADELSDGDGVALLAPVHGVDAGVPVVITTKIARPTNSGIQPPSAIFVRLAMKNAISTHKNSEKSAIATQAGQRHNTRMTR